MSTMKLLLCFVGLARSDAGDLLRGLGIIGDDATLFDEMGWNVMLNIFCTEGKQMDPQFVKKEFKELGFTVAAAHKVYLYFKSIRDA